MSIIEESARCLKCKVARCQKNCPVSTQIPEVVKLFEANRIKDAGAMLFENNPLSAITAIICPHERNCAGNCVLGLKGKPISFYKIEQYVSNFYLNSYQPTKPVSNGLKLAVIGAGPAGITMSIIMALRGYSVTLVEAHSQIGGVLRYGIPEFRLPKSILDKYMEILIGLGVKFKPNTFIGSNLSVEDMFIDGYDAVFIAVGTSRPNRLGLLGETMGHVHYAIDYLKSPDAYNLGKKVVVIGAGNVALDAARVAIRKIGNGEVTIINNRGSDDMTGNIHEVEFAKLDGVKFLHQLQTIRLLDGGVMCAKVDVNIDEAGNKTYEEDLLQRTSVDADTIILAIGQGPQAAVLSDVENVTRNNRGLFEVDDNGNTGKAGVFAAGDIVSGPKTVVEAVAFTKRVAEEIDLYCKSKQTKK